MQKLQYKEMSFSCASIIWIRFQGTFSGGFIFPKPPPLTKIFQFIAIGKNVKQNKSLQNAFSVFLLFYYKQDVSEKETVQSLNGSKPDINNLHTTKFGSTSQVRVFAELSHYNPFIYLLHVIADNCFAHGK